MKLQLRTLPKEKEKIYRKIQLRMKRGKSKFLVDKICQPTDLKKKVAKKAINY